VGCSTTLGGTAIDRRPFAAQVKYAGISNDLSVGKSLGLVTGKACQKFLFDFIPIGGMEPTYENAKQAIKQETGARYLKNVENRFSEEKFIVFTTECVELKGEAFK
jgi:hypothetical protein